jgi:hypothetical protein
MPATIKTMLMMTSALSASPNISVDSAKPPIGVKRSTCVCDVRHQRRIPEDRSAGEPRQHDRSDWNDANRELPNGLDPERRTEPILPVKASPQHSAGDQIRPTICAANPAKGDLRAKVADGCRRIAIVAPTAADARDVMIEGARGARGT